MCGPLIANQEVQQRLYDLRSVVDVAGPPVGRDLLAKYSSYSVDYPIRWEDTTWNQPLRVASSA